MRAAMLRTIGLGSLGTLAMIAGACSIAGLDDYAAGAGGDHPGSGSSAGSGLDAGLSDAGPDGSCPPCGCVDLSADPSNCGACGVACAAGYACSAGVCGNVPVDVSAAGLDTCVALHGGEVWCWGRDVWGEVGIAPAMADGTAKFQNDRYQSTPIKVAGITDAVEIALGSEIACARSANGDVYCWGSNDNGGLGHSPGKDMICAKAGGPNNGSTGRCSPTPTKVSFPAGVAAAELSVGSYTACIRTTVNDVYCWGTNRDGEVQNPLGNYVFSPTKNANVNGDAAEVAVSSSAENYSTVCIRRSPSNRVECWGQSTNNNLYPGANFAGCSVQGSRCDTQAHVVPTVFTKPTMAVTADQIQVGYFVGCALLGGVVSCWGDNRYGQRGNGTIGFFAQHFDPAPIAGLPMIASISLQFATTMAIDTNGNVWALGWNSSGQTGDGSFDGDTCNGATCVTKAKQIPGLTNIAKVSVNMESGAAITRDGKVLTWGSNYTGELGHAPSAKAGDVACPGGSAYFCNPTPLPVNGLP